MLESVRIALILHHHQFFVLIIVIINSNVVVASLSVFFIVDVDVFVVKAYGLVVIVSQGAWC